MADRLRVNANLAADRLRVNKLALKVPAWVALAVARLNEVPGHLRWPPSFAECAATLAFSDELLVLPGDELLVLPDDEYEDEQEGDEEDDQQGDQEEEQQGDEEEDEQLGWRTPGGRDLAAAYLLPRAETALRQELLRLADAAKRAREGQSSSSSSDERLARDVTARGLVGDKRRG